MRLFVAGVMALALSVGSTQAQDASTRYQALLAKAKAGDPTDWQALRFAYWDAGGRQAPIEMRVAMTEALNAKRFDQALASAQAVIEKNYVNIEAHIVAGSAYRGLKRTAESDREWAIAIALLKSIETSDGLTPKTAFTVISIDEEYQLINVFGRKLTLQSLMHGEDGHSYDVMTTKKAGGPEVVYYFQIDRLMAAEAKALDFGK